MSADMRSQAQERQRSAAVALDPNGPPPSVTIRSPQAGQALGGTFRVVVESVQGQAMEHVAFYVDGRLFNSDFEPPFEQDWDTRQEADGPHLLQIKGFGPGFGEVASARVPVTVDNMAPTVSLVAPADAATVQGQVELKVSASDALGLRGVVFLIDGKEAAEGSSSPYQFRWDSSAMPNGHHTVQARAVDRAGNSAASNAASVWVANRNRPPVLSSVGDLDGLEGTVFRFKLNAKDPDEPRDRVSYKISGLPDWMYLDPETGVVEGVPDYDEALLETPVTDYPRVVIDACDPQPLCARQTTKVSVKNLNRRPILEPIGNQSVNEAQLLKIAMVVHDPDQDVLTCHAYNLPEWMAFEPDACMARGIPGPGVATLLEPTTVFQPVRFQVCDAGPLCDEESISVTVHDIQNRSPTIEPVGNKTVDEGQRLHFTVRTADPDGEVPSVIGAPLPEDARLIEYNNGTGEFDWTPRADQSGTYEVTFSATDGALTVDERVIITVRETSLAISGLIKDETNIGLAGAMVALSSLKETIATTTTDETGYYIFSGLRADTYVITPTYNAQPSFSAEVRRAGTMIFTPTIKRVHLKDKDLWGVHFISTPP